MSSMKSSTLDGIAVARASGGVPAVIREYSSPFAPPRITDSWDAGIAVARTDAALAKAGWVVIPALKVDSWDATAELLEIISIYHIGRGRFFYLLRRETEGNWSLGRDKTEVWQNGSAEEGFDFHDSVYRKLSRWVLADMLCSSTVKTGRRRRGAGTDKHKAGAVGKTRKK